MPKNLLSKALKEVRANPRKLPPKDEQGHRWEYLGGMSGTGYCVQFWSCLRCGSNAGPGNPLKCLGKRILSKRAPIQAALKKRKSK